MSGYFMIPKENYDKLFDKLASTLDELATLRAQNRALKEKNSELIKRIVALEGSDLRAHKLADYWAIKYEEVINGRV